MNQGLTFAICVGLGLAVCTASFAERRDESVGGAFAQPFRDIGMVRDEVPDILKHAVAAPYALPGARSNGDVDCSALVSEIVSLDLALGADVDAPPVQHANGSNLMAGAVRSVLHVPYRGVLRRITGAEHREQVLQTAIQAGMVRRAFLKGLRMRDCDNVQGLPQTIATELDSTPLAEPAPSTMAAAEAPAPAPQVATVSLQANAPSVVAAQPVVETVASR